MDALFLSAQKWLIGAACLLSAITMPSIVLLVLARKEVVRVFRNAFRKRG